MSSFSTMKSSKLNLVIAFLSFTNCLSIHCDWNLEFLCGDKCVNFDKNGICYCGIDILDYKNLTDISNNICCNDGPCKKERKGDVHCLGTKQDVALPCHGNQCYQTASWGYNTLFENYSKCLIWILAFSINFCPFKTDLSGNTVWPQASGFQKLAKMDHFQHF